MPVLTIAIPTFNRVDKLGIAVDAISKLIVPRDLTLCLAISNSQSEDATERFLRQLSLPNAELILNNKEIVHLNNWAALSRIVPDHSDFVWLHGDDDIIFDREALLRLESFGAFDTGRQIAITSIPQARRSLNSGCHPVVSLGAYACRYGCHELLGWMSSLLLNREAYFAFMANYEIAYDGNPDTSAMHARGLGNLLHMTFFVENFWSSNTILVDVPFIDEQIDAESKKQYVIARRQSEFRSNYLFSDRFFFDAKKLTRLASLHALAGNDIFFRYTTKSLLDVLVTITRDELGSADVPGRLPVADKIQIIEDAYGIMSGLSHVESLGRRIGLLKSAVHEGRSGSAYRDPPDWQLAYPSTVVF